MKTETEYRKELIKAMGEGNTERAKDLKGLINGTAIEPQNFMDLLKASDNNLRIIQTPYTQEFRKQFC